MECVTLSQGIYFVDGQWVRLLPDIEKGTIVTCGGILDGYFLGKKMPGVLIIEDGGAKHPTSGVVLLRQPHEFKEIQPPLSVDIESLIEQPIVHA